LSKIENKIGPKKYVCPKLEERIYFQGSVLSFVAPLSSWNCTVKSHLEELVACQAGGIKTNLIVYQLNVYTTFSKIY